MKRFLFVLSIFMCTLTIVCSCEQKNYSVEVNDGSVIVKMHSPSRGVVSLYGVNFDGFTIEDVEEEIFDKIRSSNYEGYYTVYVILQYRDSYGNFYDGPQTKVSTLQSSEVKKYASYGYFRGQTHLEYSYLGKPKKRCEHCTNGVIQLSKTVTEDVECQNCNGTGLASGYDITNDKPILLPCHECAGSGKKYEEHTETQNITCQFCGGKGEVDAE